LASTTETIRIHYHRPPDRDDVFVQQLLERTADCVVTFMPATPLKSPVMVRDRIVLEDSSAAIWFTFRDAWHDIGLFHMRDGTFTGTYANAITPVRSLDSDSWETTDLFLDFWLGADGVSALLDEDEFDDALSRNLLDAETAARAVSEMMSIVRATALGEWPPAIVRQWDLGRAIMHETRGTPPLGMV
jgi:predicted RNA-binding protein associated with RNAse of E/G family